MRVPGACLWPEWFRKMSSSHDRPLRTSFFWRTDLLATTLAIAGLTLICPNASIANDPVFDRDVAPVLARRCLECHDSSAREGGLDLSTGESLMGEGQVLIIAGDADASLLWQRVARDEMPPDRPLDAKEKEIIRAWVDSGAVWVGGPIDLFRYSSEGRAGYDWWSLQPLAESMPLPPVGPSGAQPIDRFVDAKLAELGLSPFTRADPRTLVRRLYDDLVGLAPTYDDVARFSADPSDAAWGTLVDRLLASPEFGERWAQHWLDIARFGESDGFEYNQPRDHAWHYRDWVIDAFNQDLPYDRFAQMQVAGDLIVGQTTEGLAAIGFLVAGVHNPVIGQSEEMRANARHAELEEIAATFSQAFLGLTLHCARCHDHKYDPIATEDYYRFIAALDGVRHGNRVEQPSDPDAEVVISARRAELRKALSDQQSRRGAIVSQSGNAVVSRQSFAANAAEQKYQVRITVSPTVWADPIQATRPEDGVLIRLVHEDGSVAHHFVAQPGGWQQAGSRPSFVTFDFEYVGDGSGDLRVRLESLMHENRFGGSVDELSIGQNDGRVLFAESFDDLTGSGQPATQADTSAKIYYGMESSRWEHSGVNAIHAVELTSGNYAVQLFGGVLDTEVEPGTELEMLLQRELDALPALKVGAPIYTVVPGEPVVMHVMRRGDPMQPLGSVVPGAPRSIQGPASDWTQSSDSSDAERRLGLARWLTDRRNGPFHRTAVNRFWHLLLGRGLVATPSDLGFQGGKPTHPELLEWLAIEFRASDLSMKKLIRQIVMSEAYRRSSLGDVTLRERGEALDQEAVWLWRRQPERLQAEVIRDSMLAITGALSPHRFGPGYRDVAVETVGAAHYYRAMDLGGEEFDRRTIYRWRPRGERSSLLEAFDCPDPSAAAPKRAVTTTPNQALSLWNHAFVLRMSRQLAARVIEEEGDVPEKQVRAAWLHVLLREPSTEEQVAGLELLTEFGLNSLCRVLFNTAETVTLD
jgi:hypothetical protein